MTNSLTKNFNQALYQPPDIEIFTPAYTYFKSDFDARLINSKYEQLNISIYSGVHFEYDLYHTYWGGGGFIQYDDYGNEILKSSGWYVQFLTMTGGSLLPPDLKVKDSDVDTKVGGEMVTVTDGIKTITPPLQTVNISDMGWNGTAVSAETKQVPFFAEFSINVLSQGVIIGINDNANDSSSYHDINYGIYSFGNFFQIIENGKIRLDPILFKTTDVFKIKIIGDYVTYFLNDNLITETLRNESNTDFKLDVSLYSSGDQVLNASLSDIDLSVGDCYQSLSLTSTAFSDDVVSVGQVSQSLVMSATGSDTTVGGFPANCHQSLVMSSLASSDDQYTVGQCSQSLVMSSVGYDNSNLGHCHQKLSMSAVGYSYDALTIGNCEQSLVMSAVGYAVEEITPPVLAHCHQSLVMTTIAVGDNGIYSLRLFEQLPFFSQVGEIIDNGQPSYFNVFCLFGSNTLEEIEIPIKSVSGSLSNASGSSVLVVVPDGAKWSYELSARSDGWFRIKTISYVAGNEIIDISEKLNIQDVSSFQGSRSFSINVRGTNNHSRSSGNFVQIYGQQDNETSYGKRRLRCSLNMALLPSDTVIPQVGSNFVVRQITWTINSQSKFMDVSE